MEKVDAKTDLSKDRALEEKLTRLDDPETSDKKINTEGWENSTKQSACFRMWFVVHPEPSIDKYFN